MHQPLLEEGHDVTVVLLQPEFRDHRFELEVKFKRTVLLDLKLFDDGKDSGGWAFGPQHTVRLASAGTLQVETRVLPTGQAGRATSFSGNGGKACIVSDTLKKTLSFDVGGHYHFMLGVMPTYAGLFDRKHTLNRSDDGVQRVYAQEIREVDWALTLSGYPWGVSPDDFGALGLVVATSLRDIGKRWYTGIEWASPIGLGIVGGAALIVVPQLDEDFLTGQPLTDTQVPVHNSAVVTWFLGINIEAHLFRKAFKALAPDE